MKLEIKNLRKSFDGKTMAPGDTSYSDDIEALDFLMKAGNPLVSLAVILL